MPTSWDRWSEHFEQAGYAAVTPSLPDDPNRGHSLTIDSGWREVADTALKFVQRFT
jgi:non-heme chloroperoxidase